MKTLISLLIALILIAPPAYADIVWAEAGPYTGTAASFGTSQEAGVKMAVEDINADGGINGQKIVLRTFDDACDPKQAVAVANKIISQNIKIAIHASCSASAIASEKTYVDEGTVVMNPTATNPKYTDDGGPTVFRGVYRDDTAAQVISAYIAKNFSGKKLAIINDKATYGLGIATLVRDDVNKAGIKEIMFEPYDPTSHDYSVLSTRLKASGAEVIFIGGLPADAAMIIRQLHEAGSTAQVIAGDLSIPEVWKIAASGAEGSLFAFPSDPRKQPAAAAVINRLEKSGVIVDGYTLYAYAAAQALAQAEAKAQTDGPGQIADVLHKGEFNTILGTWSFTDKGDVRNIHEVMFRWHDGQFSEVGE